LYGTTVIRDLARKRNKEEIIGSTKSFVKIIVFAKGNLLLLKWKQRWWLYTYKKRKSFHPGSEVAFREGIP